MLLALLLVENNYMVTIHCIRTELIKFLYSNISPVFDITDMYNFADNNFVLQVNVNKQTLCSNMEIELAKLVKWLRGCGLKVDTNSTPC